MLDQSIEYGVRMSKMIDDVTKDIPDRADEAERGNRRMTNFDDFLAEVHTVAIGRTHPSRWSTVWAPALLLIITLKHGIPTLM